MKREYIKELRVDSRKEAFDLYNHVDLKELKEALFGVHTTTRYIAIFV